MVVVMRVWIWRAALAIGCTGLLCGSSASTEDYYRDKSMRLVVGTDVGGSYDMSARLIGRFLQRFVPGAPAIIVQNLPGASSVNAANILYNIAPQDGTVLGAFVQTLPLSQLFRDAETKFEVDHFQWIGNPTSSPNVIVTLKDSGIASMQEAMAKPVLIGVTSRASSGGLEVALANNVLGTLFKPVTGYKGGGDLDLAMERREVLGRAGQSWEGWKQTRPEWTRNNMLNVLVQIGERRARDLPNVPLITEIARDDNSRQVLGIYSGTIGLGRPLAFGPGVPKERVQTLREAFRRMMADPEFNRAAASIGYEIDPIIGEDLQAIISRLIKTPKDIVEQARRAMELKNP